MIQITDIGKHNYNPVIRTIRVFVAANSARAIRLVSFMLSWLLQMVPVILGLYYSARVIMVIAAANSSRAISVYVS
jgi:hypothetical protein